jgi:hypothetical protein
MELGFSRHVSDGQALAALTEICMAVIGGGLVEWRKGTSFDTVGAITIELVEADESPAVVIIRWPVKPTVCSPRRFPDTAATIARLFAEAATRLAGLQAGRRL